MLACRIPTSTFFQSFSTVFSKETGGSPNAAFTFVHKDDAQFDGPLIAVIIEGFNVEIADGVPRYTYKLGQSMEQDQQPSLDSFFYGSDSVTFADCSLFIDSVTYNVV